MRNLLISAAIVSAAALAAPATAQYQDGRYGYSYGQNINRQLHDIRQRIDRAEDRDRISRREARRLFRQADHVEQRFHNYRRGGLSRWESQDLQNRIYALRQQLRWERRDGR
jgi:hypothetical protein